MNQLTPHEKQTLRALIRKLDASLVGVNASVLDGANMTWMDVRKALAHSQISQRNAPNEATQNHMAGRVFVLEQLLGGEGFGKLTASGGLCPDCSDPIPVDSDDGTVPDSCEVCGTELTVRDRESETVTVETVEFGTRN